LDAIAMTVFELAYEHARGSCPAELSGLLGHVAFICLAPFLGANETNAFIAGKTRSE
jgi:hypothetical protein